MSEIFPGQVPLKRFRNILESAFLKCENCFMVKHLKNFIWVVRRLACFAVELGNPYLTAFSYLPKKLIFDMKTLIWVFFSYYEFFSLILWVFLIFDFWCVTTLFAMVSTLFVSAKRSFKNSKYEKKVIIWEIKTHI